MKPWMRFQLENTSFQRCNSVDVSKKINGVDGASISIPTGVGILLNNIGSVSKVLMKPQHRMI